MTPPRVEGGKKKSTLSPSLLGDADHSESKSNEGRDLLSQLPREIKEEDEGDAHFICKVLIIKAVHQEGDDEHEDHCKWLSCGSLSKGYSRIGRRNGLKWSRRP